MPDEITPAEREIAKEVADKAMIIGWNQAIDAKASELGTDDLVIRRLLNRVSEFNDKADPSGRIEELEDWETEKRGRSERAAMRGQGKAPIRTDVRS